ncbi:nitrile hydratase [Lichenicoccus sp.]|uniref:nitrile hydratase n=1 Tax=Lichenicoccus sp. TaxID=2781899 RepID=UPI003D0BFB90
MAVSDEHEKSNEAHPGRAHHDIGGVSRFCCMPIDTEPHALTGFDLRVDALRQLLSAKGLMTVDELRRGIEAIPEAQYHALSYYQRWMRSITATLLRRGVIDEAALHERLARQGTPR